MCSYSLWLLEWSPSFPEWPVCELLLGRLKERVHKETKSTGGDGYPTTEWLNKYESIKDKLACKTDMDAYFTKKMIETMAVDVLDIGSVYFPSGTIFACDPLVELEDALPFLQTIPSGTYPVKICVVPSEQYGDRYACVKVEIIGKNLSAMSWA